ncbi:MAG: hypothetical protein DCC71_00010 [Proteobacteria bacterium]|nr:MAG: hypothetical protein DCC71_00010 [Pseudomonadota bacterium]
MQRLAAPWLALALFACAPGAPAEATGAATLAALEGGEWIAVAIDGAPLPADARPPTAAFADERIAGFGGCNRYTGSARVRAGGEIALGPLAATKMACPEPASALEARFFATLAQVARWSLDGERLTLSGADAARSVAFARR